MTVNSAVLHLIVSTCATAEFFEEIPAPNLARGSNNFQPWLSSDPPHTDYQQTKDSRSYKLDSGSDSSTETLQQKLRDKRKISSGIFLPGIGIFKNISPGGPRPQREAIPSKTKESELSPSLVTVSDYDPPSPPTNSDGKCQYKQVMNTTTGEDCTKGGMRCERKCKQKTGEPVCTEEFTDICEDVPKDLCETVNDKSCKSVQEEVCDDADDSQSKMECSVDLNEECKMVEEEECVENTQMECKEVEKQVCTAIREQVCSPTLENFCHEEEKKECSLVPEVVCRNVTQTRFDEKCWSVEEEVCRTVYDTVSDKKCEMVNITVPQRECDSFQEMHMEKTCRVVNETINTPVCVTIMDQDVEETCENEIPSTKCFQPSCRNVTRPLLKKDCREVYDEQCEVIIEQTMEEQCTEVEQTEYEEQCTNGYEQQCETVQQYQCQDEAVAAVAPPTSYGAPLAPILTSFSLNDAETPKFAVSPNASSYSAPQTSKFLQKPVKTSPSQIPISLDSYKAPQVSF